MHNETEKCRLRLPNLANLRNLCEKHVLLEQEIDCQDAGRGFIIFFCASIRFLSFCRVENIYHFCLHASQWSKVSITKGPKKC